MFSLAEIHLRIILKAGWQQLDLAKRTLLMKLILGAVIIVILLYACRKIVFVGEEYPSTNHVDLFCSWQAVLENHRVIGHFVPADEDMTNLPKMRRQMLKAARKKGADALVIVGAGPCSGGAETPDSTGCQTMKAHQIKVSLLRYRVAEKQPTTRQKPPRLPSQGRIVSLLWPSTPEANPGLSLGDQWSNAQSAATMNSIPAVRSYLGNPLYESVRSASYWGATAIEAGTMGIITGQFGAGATAGLFGEGWLYASRAQRWFRSGSRLNQGRWWRFGFGKHSGWKVLRLSIGRGKVTWHPYTRFLCRR
jgi:hypothetical protein